MNPRKISKYVTVIPNDGTKLARLVYRILRYGTKYVDRGAQFYAVQQRTRDIKYLRQRAANLARLVYRMLRYGMKYVNQGAASGVTQNRPLRVT